MKPGEELYVRHPDREPELVGRILVFVEATGLLIYLEPQRRRETDDIDEADESAATEGRNGRAIHYMRGPNFSTVEKLQTSLDGELYSIPVTASDNDVANLSDEELLDPNKLPPHLRRTRRQLETWIRRRDDSYSLIEPILTRYTIEELLVHGFYAKAIKERCKGGPPSMRPRVYRALHTYWYGGSVKNALLPGWGRCGRPGKPKFAASGTGRPTAKGKFNCTEEVRKKLGWGWKKYKKPRVSVKVAYFRTMNKYWAESTSYDDQGKRTVRLLQPGKRPSMAQFQRHGPANDPALTASRVNTGTRSFNRDQRGLRGTSSDGILAIGHGVIDSTSCDQNLVDSASRSVLLRSPTDTRVVEPITGYVFGSYVGFESPSTLTSLLAVFHAASSKVGNFYGHVLSEGDWHSWCPRRILADNGEIKSEKGMATLSRAEIALEFTSSYGAEHKYVEADHHRRHRLTNHLLPGSSKGEQRGRGDADPAKDACLTFEEYMYHHVQGILYTNNVELVPHLLTMEMRRDGVKPTRRAILEWLMRNGYLMSEPTILHNLRAQCLPQLKAVMHADGIHLFDPRNPQRLIPNLVYRSKWLEESGWLAKARRKSIPMHVHIDPSCVGQIHASLDGELRDVPLRVKDPEVMTLAILDWLTITDHDALRGFVLKGAEEDAFATHVARIDDTEARAKAAKAANQGTAGTGKANASKKKRANTEAEADRLKSEQMGFGDPPKPVPLSDGEFIDPYGMFEDEVGFT